jgi:ATP-dependent exoDNAse (exonuclease V) alpha subunit
LWNEVEEKEIRKDAQLAREIEVALPRELTLEEQKELVREYAQEQFVDQGMIADLNIHHHKDNPHAHIMLTTRRVTEEGFAEKVRDWKKKRR